ncbi:M14 family zinc carboxypeptidase [Algoriphagus sp. AK58]|uniref:M14 family zinc carboxypeptidase n=1 Tax=Algoriphagus sp. AK58 TaxID=1406877 RepID=UPI00164F709F|nr:M14 family zinc carboxypeptidase [Algoriphagus sp. AK58]MBC6365717.1 peptidase M14 [Algoriphagus sp. AK58]
MKSAFLTPFLLFFLVLSFYTSAQVAYQKMPVEKLEAAYEKYKEPAITHRRFKHADLQPLIQKHGADFKLEELGKSVEGRSITSMKWGQGATKVMLWSQMHGNESTATMALFDLFNFLEGKNDGYDELRTLLKNQISLKFIPMINPDGAYAFKRRNALDIDLNRDAISQISPEAVILKKARDDFEPEFGFNLHDQQIYYNVVNTPKQATISLLAPAYNYETEINEVRGRAMQTIAGMNELLQELIPGQVGKYDDAFEPRAFGDNIQKWGTSTILIESGGYQGDPEKQYIRKINFMIILNALHQIATRGYEQYTTEQYFAIPDNGFQLMDLIINEMQVNVKGEWYPLDIAIRRRETENAAGYFMSASVEDLGDMQIFFGFETLDATGLQYLEGKVYSTAFESVKDISEEKAIELLRQGFMAVKVKNGEARQMHSLPILVLKTTEKYSSGWMTGSATNFFLAKEGKPRYAIVNGYLIDLENPKKQEIRNRVF